MMLPFKAFRISTEYPGIRCHFCLIEVYHVYMYLKFGCSRFIWLSEHKAMQIRFYAD